MQTTLLGIAILFILALVTALVGPLFVDWNQYRAQFEAQATSLTGLQVRLAGPIEARLLPTPRLTLARIDMSRPGEAGAVTAQRLNIEFALGALMRGEWKAAEVRLESAEFALGLDAEGRLDWPAPTLPVDPDVMSIQRLDIVNSRALLTDAASGASLLIDKLDFRGELRSLAGPLRGEGSFQVAGQHYPYRVAASRPAAGPGEGGAVRVRLNIDPIDRPLLADADALISIERGVPRFEGTLSLARPVGRGASGVVEPWRLSTRFRGDSAAAVLEGIEFQYGPEDRSIRLKGDARLGFGARPQLAGVLSATQVDLDRVLALPDPLRRRPVAAVKALAEQIAAAQTLSIPVRLGLSVENLTLAGATLQRVSSDLTIDDRGLDIETLELRAPGLSQLRLSGRLSADAHGVAFRGPVRFDARDPRALLAWLGDRTEAQAVAAGMLHLEGDVSLGSEAIVLDRLDIELDRMTMAGRLAYSWASGGRPARIEAAMDAPQVDLDRVHALVRAAVADIPFEWPGEGALAVRIGRASLAGVEAGRLDVNATFDPQGLAVDRLAIGDLGGASVTAKGRIDTRARDGTITLDLDARALDGIAELVDRFAPAAAAELRRNAQRLVPARLRAILAVNAAAAAAPALATLTVEGSASMFRFSAQAVAGEAVDAVTIDDLRRLISAKANVTGRVEAGDGSALVQLLGLERLVAVSAGPGRISFAMRGPFNDAVAVDGQLTAGGLDVGANGTIRISSSDAPSADLSIKIASATVRTAHATLPAALTGRLSYADGALGLTDVSGRVGDSDIAGRLKIGFAEPRRIDGSLTLGVLDLPAALAVAIGVPPAAANDAATRAWQGEPFEPAIVDNLIGQVTVKAARVALTPAVTASDVNAIARFDGATLVLEGIDGALAGGRVAGALTFRRGAEGLAARSQIKIVGGELAQLIPGGGQPPLSGRVDLDLDIEGAGRSPSALVGSLHGRAAFTVRDGAIARLDPGTFAAVTHSVEQGLPIDAQRIRDRVELTLGNGALAIPLAQGEVAIADGQARLANIAVPADGAELAIVTNVALADATLDAKLTLTGPAGALANGGRPMIGIVLRGPLDAPKRTIDVAAFSSWLALRAVEHQSKRIDALEAGRELPADAPTSSLPDASAPTTVAPRPRVQPPPPVQRPGPSTQAPALPPPVDIRAAPAPRAPNSTARSEPQPKAARPAASPPTSSPPTLGSSILDSLFGR